jgi:hypothetical protein
VALPLKAHTTFGAGEVGEEWSMDKDRAGDILHGVTTRVPPARTIYKDLTVPEEIADIRVWDSKRKDYELVEGTHWGFGITLLHRDRDIVRKLLKQSVNQTTDPLSPHLLAALLRGFFGGRSYTRLYNLGGSRGWRVNSIDFLQHRLEAMKGKFSQIECLTLCILF